MYYKYNMHYYKKPLMHKQCNPKSFIQKCNTCTTQVQFTLMKPRINFTGHLNYMSVHGLNMLTDDRQRYRWMREIRQTPIYKLTPSMNPEWDSSITLCQMWPFETVFILKTPVRQVPGSVVGENVRKYETN